MSYGLNLALNPPAKQMLLVLKYFASFLGGTNLTGPTLERRSYGQ